jgi:hypothetical protein
MTIRTIRKTIIFLKPFCLKGVDRVLPPRDYNVVTDEELIEGLLFSAYHRVSTAIFVPAPSGSAIEMVTIDPLDLEAALNKMRQAHPRPTNRASGPAAKDRRMPLRQLPHRSGISGSTRVRGRGMSTSCKRRTLVGGRATAEKFGFAPSGRAGPLANN